MQDSLRFHRRPSNIFEFEMQDELKKNLQYFAEAQLNWILGLNPFNMCMLHGHGRNNPSYEIAYPPTVFGGICNGIHGGYNNELEIDFAPQGLSGDQIGLGRTMDSTRSLVSF